MQKYFTLFTFIISLFCASMAQSQVFYGKASWYGSKFHGRTTASGEIYDMNKLTAAHKSLPFGTLVQVTNLDNGKVVTVKITDRGPFVQGRILDLSRKGAEELDFIRQGVANIKMEVISPQDTKQLMQNQPQPKITPQTNENTEEKEIAQRPEEEKESDITEQDTIDSIITALKSDTGKGSDEELLEGSLDSAKKQEEPTEIKEKQTEAPLNFEESKAKEEEIPLDNKGDTKFEQRAYQIFIIQLGAFSSQEKAQKFVKKLEEKNINTYITSVERDKQTLYKVRDKKVYRNLEEVLSQAKKVKEMGLECFVVGKFFAGP